MARTIRFGECEYTFPSEQLGELRDSNDLLDDVAALHRRFDEDGYLLLRGLIDRETMRRGRQTILEYMHEREALVPGEPVLDGVMPRDGRTVPLMGRPHVTHHPDVLACLEAESLRRFYDRLFGEPSMTFNYKWLRAVGNEKCTGAHFDVVYMGRGSKRVMTAWVPFGDIPIEQGTLAICVGSHNLPGFEKLRQTYGRMDVDRDRVEGWFTTHPKEVTERFGGRWCTTGFRAGDVLTFGMYTMHASTTNTTNRYRLSCDVRWQPAADPIDDRWAGREPKGHDAADDRPTVSMAEARAGWGL